MENNMDKLWSVVLITIQEDPCSSGEMHVKERMCSSVKVSLVMLKYWRKAIFY